MIYNMARSYDLLYDKIMWFIIWINHMIYSVKRSYDLQYN